MNSNSMAAVIVSRILFVAKTMMYWNEYELVEFFGVLPEADEDSPGYTFRVEKEDLRLEVTFFPATHQYLRAGEVYIDLFHGGREEPIFKMTIRECPGFKYTRHQNGWECLEIAAPAQSIFMEENWLIPMGARITVNPRISIKIFQSETSFENND